MSDPSTPAPTLAEVEARFEQVIRTQRGNAARMVRAQEGCDDDLSEYVDESRQIEALYSLALSCVRAVRAPAYLVVLDKNDVPISTWKRDERLSLGEQEAKMRAVFNDEDFPHHRPFTLLPLYALPAAILTALPEPPHAE